MLFPTRVLIPASATRNWCAQDPILDWLELYGKAKGFTPDTDLPGYSIATDMLPFIAQKGREFEAAVMRCLQDNFQIVRIVPERGARKPDEQGSLFEREEQRQDWYDRTLQAMAEGVEIIYQGYVEDKERGTFGYPDLLVRSDLLNRLVDKPCVSEAESAIPLRIPNHESRITSAESRITSAESRITPSHHYRVLDIKFTNLGLNAKEWVGNDASDRRRKAQLLVYNRALGLMQGYEPPTAYLLGRSWAYKSKGQEYRGGACLERLGPCDMQDPELHQLVDEAIDWARRVREEGAAWHVYPRPSIPELHPNMKNSTDAPWHAAKKEIADRTDELTRLWYISPDKRQMAHDAGIVTFQDERCDELDFGYKDNRLETLRKVIQINRSGCPDKVRPAKVTANEQDWRVPNPLEFYVDFETVTDLDDDFTRMPQKGGQSLIFMIGCGHIENGEWVCEVFTCDRLTEACERQIIDAWHAHMAKVTERLWPGGTPLVFHWSHAEQSFLNTSYNSARDRHQADWPPLNWYDLLNKVAKEEPITAKGAFAFGLKSVAKALHGHGLIETNWTNGPTDGLGAMVGAWTCDREAAAKGCSMKDLPLMQEIESYNRVDCKVMWEVLTNLRTSH